MKNNIRHIITAAILAMFVAWPAQSYAQDVKQGIETEQQSISVQMINNSVLQIKNAEHMVVEIFSITGEKVYTARIDGQAKQVDLGCLPKGIYVVKVGKFTRKVYVK